MSALISNKLQAALQNYTSLRFARTQTMACDNAQLAAILKDVRGIAIAGLLRRFESPGNEVAVYPKITGSHIKQTHTRLLQVNRLWC